jgi:hypothetical protein
VKLKGMPLFLLLAGPMGAQETSQQQADVQPPGGAREKVEKRYQLPEPVEPGPTTAVVKGSLAPRASADAAAEAPAFKGARWVALDGDEARVALAGGEQRLQVGSTVAGDRVKSVRPRQLVLERPAAPGQPGGSALVIVDFREDATRVRVLWSQDPKAATPAEAR